ncbi:hypothetical protein PORY_002544 [Pneumocystis oryctolagi]|uniref:Uncharacterized protein n=1 Tax=Pneumocystis oryctolagi TaxID=42067 RepID=A0ACB7C8P5_9ASCO|nr:hypothetical protein PORY_002544 [Pneumocystis oryctolagi]
MSNSPFAVNAVYSFQKKQIKSFKYDLLLNLDNKSLEDNVLLELESNIIKIQEDCNKFLTEEMDKERSKRNT